MARSCSSLVGGGCWQEAGAGDISPCCCWCNISGGGGGNSNGDGDKDLYSDEVSDGS